MIIISEALSGVVVSRTTYAYICGLVHLGNVATLFVNNPSMMVLSFCHTAHHHKSHQITKVSFDMCTVRDSGNNLSRPGDIMIVAVSLSNMAVSRTPYIHMLALLGMYHAIVLGHNATILFDPFLSSHCQLS
jgi:hypothetical protein